MAKYTYTGEVTLELPTLALTVNPGDTFEAPDGLIADNIIPAKAKPSPDTTQGA